MNQLRLRVGCTLSFAADDPNPGMLCVQPRDEPPHRVLEERFELDPAIELRPYRDLYGNRRQRMVVPPGGLRLRYEADVEVDGAPDPVEPDAVQHPVEDLPDDVLPFTLPSRYCLPDELMGTAWELFGNTEPGWGRAQAVCDWVFGHLGFQYGSSNPLTTAVDVYESGAGVCRDFTHLAVTFCRALNLPARYVFGYLPDIGVMPHEHPMDFCAWMEVFLGGRWYTFDPRNNDTMPRVGRVLIGRGRDALDVAMITTFGAARLAGMTVTAEQRPAAEPAGRASG